MAEDIVHKAVAIVGVGAVLPDAPDAAAFWDNVRGARYSITETPKERWDPDLYFDPDPQAPDKTYSKIGGWVRDYGWDPLAWRLPIPPKVAEAMDRTQKWAIAAGREALLDYGWPERVADPDRTAVILGNAMGGDQHYLTAVRSMLPEIADVLTHATAFSGLSADVRAAILDQLRSGVGDRLPPITEDTMPGELGSITAGRVANVFDFHGPNYIVDAACASAMAAMNAAVEGLAEYDFDLVVTGGIDANMGPSSFVKFCKIGALSATGTRPYGEGADGFVMGEGAAVFVLRRLEDAERDGDRIYAVIRGFGGSSDGRGKGITAPNPIGQVLAVRRAWARAGLDPASVGLLEGHGTSTKVGDVVEVGALNEVFGEFDLPTGGIPLGSVKSNIGHLKAAAGAAGILKATLAVHEGVLPPSLGFARPNPDIDFANSPFAVNTELREWTNGANARRAGVSAFGFGGTNFHAVIEQHVPGRLTEPKTYGTAVTRRPASPAAPELKTPVRGALVLGAGSNRELASRVQEVAERAAAGEAPEPVAPAEADLRSAVRLAVDYGDAEELAVRLDKALRALESEKEGMWKALARQGVFYGRGSPPKVAFLFTGQGSQYLNMLRELAELEPIVGEAFAEADEVMTPLLGRPLTDYIFIDTEDDSVRAEAENDLLQTEITQPAVLTIEAALTRLLAAYGVVPDMVMGHSLGEYGALVASGALPFADALTAVSARGREMAHLEVPDRGRMVAVLGRLEDIERIINQTDGYVVVANINSTGQAVIGGATEAVEAAVDAFKEAGMRAIPLSVSHAFHTSIVAPASEPLATVLRRLRLRPPALPLVANLTGELYPSGPGVEPQMVDILAAQVASPVQFVKGLETLWREGARLFVEVGPKRALTGFAEDVIGGREGVNVLFTNTPTLGDVVSFNRSLCGFYAAGLGVGTEVGSRAEAPPPTREERPAAPTTAVTPAPKVASTPFPVAVSAPAPPAGAEATQDATLLELGRIFAHALQEGARVAGVATPLPAERVDAAPVPADRVDRIEPVVITGAGLGLPGGGRMFDDTNIPRILRGEVLVDSIPVRFRERMTDKSITRLVKSENGAWFEKIDDVADVIKLAGRPGSLDLAAEYHFPDERIPALDIGTQMAIAGGLDALRDAGIPLVMHYVKTSTGSVLPERWMLPEGMRDDTGVVFASAFPGYDSLVDEVSRYHRDRSRKERLEELKSLRDGASDPSLAQEIQHRIDKLEVDRERDGYAFNRRFLFRVLSMGHSQFAEYIGARGPNTQVNAACSSTTLALATAEDWIRTGRCRRVVIVSADAVTGDQLIEWMGSGFLASGAAATDEAVEDAVIPFDRRRHGMVMGTGSAALVAESAEAARERGVTPIVEVLSTVIANSAFHGSRLDVDHIRFVMEQVVADAERRWGIDRHRIAPQTVFVSHETYTPARGGSAQAEANALRHVFADSANGIVVANTKGFTGHAMGAGVEEVVAVKILETGVVPPVPNLKEPDPDLGYLNLSRGGAHDVEYALRLSAGFGSQIALSLLRRVPAPGGVRANPNDLGYTYRVADSAAYERWLRRNTGLDDVPRELAGRTLRVIDTGPPARVPEAPLPVAPPRVDRPVEVPAAPESVPVGSAPVESAAPEGPVVDEVAVAVLGVVAEQTGYPPEMLELDLDLEADLGIDTVKQAEMFAAVREAYGIERDDSLVLRDFPTLQHVIGFVYDHRPDLRPGISDDRPQAGEVPIAAAAEPERHAPPAVRGDMEATLQLRRRVPRPVLRPELARCVSTGVTLDSGSRVVVMADASGIGASLVSRLQDRGVDVLVVDDHPDAADLTRRLEGWAGDGPVTGVFWLPAADVAGNPYEMDIATWREQLRVRVKLLFTTMKTLYDRVGGAGTFLVSATRLGGRHGYGDEGAADPIGGAVVGFTKTFKREKPDALVKAVDLPVDRKTAAHADALIAETLADPGVIEIGLTDGRRFSVALVDETAEDGRQGLELGPETVFVVTGAAGSITSAITADLAAASGGVFHLMDLVPEPDRSDPDLARFMNDRDGLKRDIFERIKASGERATPALVEKELARLERLAAAASAIDAVEAAGGTVFYSSADLRDPEAVETALSAVHERHGHIDVLLHAGGLEISRLISDKPNDQFDLVFNVKADGWFNLMRSIGDMPVAATVSFSSIAGRFGNGGQADYSAANDLLCKLAHALPATHPGTRAIAVDWTAWADIGMATRGSIPEMMRAAGIGMLPAAAAIPFIRRELTAGGRSGEVLVAGSLGVLEEPFHPTGGFEVEGLGGTEPMAGMVDGWGLSGLVVTTTLDPKEQAFLDDHRVDGTPLLPAVMGMEAFAEAASIGFPDLSVVAIEDVAFLAPFKFYRDEPRTVTVEVRFELDGDHVVADCRLVGSRLIAGSPGPVETIHHVGRVRLGVNPEPRHREIGDAAPAAVVAADDVYAVFFHGPAYRVLADAGRADGEVIGRLAEDLPANHVPKAAPTRVYPRLLELVFQTAGIWEIGTQNVMGLPTRVGRVSVFPGPADLASPVRAVVTPSPEGYSAVVVDGIGNVLVELDGYETVTLPGALPEDAVRPIANAMGG